MAVSTYHFTGLLVNLDVLRIVAARSLSLPPAFFVMKAPLFRKLKRTGKGRGG
jgi:hypothetical protein